MAEGDPRWPRRALHAFGCGFDVLTMALGVVDVVSDILVCIQFCQQGLWVPFGFCLLILLNANVVYTHFTVEQGLLTSPPMFGHVGWFLHERFVAHPHRRLLLYSLVFPIAQAMPAVNWLLCMAAGSPVKGRKNPRMLVESLHGALEDHWQTHGLFFVETIVEAIPQSILQLIVITILDQVTLIQLLSIVLSIVSIISKAYALSLSLDMRIFLLKLLMLAHDVLAMFFLFGSLFAYPSHDAAMCPLAGWGSIRVSFLACVWLWYFAILGPFFILGGILLGLYLPARAAHDGDSMSTAWRFVGIWASVWLPLLVLLPVPKLSPFVLWIHFYEPENGTSWEASVLLARLLGFTTSSHGEWATLKLRRLNLFLAAHFEQLYRNTARPECAPLLEACILCCHRTRQWCLSEPFRPSERPSLYSFRPRSKGDNVDRQVMIPAGCTRLVLPGAPRQETYFCHTCRLTICDLCTQKCHRNHWVEFGGIREARCSCGSEKPCFARAVLDGPRFWPRPGADTVAWPPAVPGPAGALREVAVPRDDVGPEKQAVRCCVPRQWLVRSFHTVETIVHGYWLVFLFVCLPFYIYGLLYPWLVVGLQVHPFSILHGFTFYGMAATLPPSVALAIWTLPPYLRFMQQCNLQHFGSLAGLQPACALPTMQDAVRACYTPTVDDVLRSVLPHPLTCHDICSVISVFLGSSDPLQVVLNFKAMVTISLFPGRGRQRPPSLLGDSAPLLLTSDSSDPPEDAVAVELVAIDIPAPMPSDVPQQPRDPWPLQRSPAYVDLHHQCNPLALPPPR